MPHLLMYDADDADDAIDIDLDLGSSGCSHNNTDMAHLSNEATAIFPYTIQYVTVLKLTMKGLRVPQLILFDTSRVVL